LGGCGHGAVPKRKDHQPELVKEKSKGMPGAGDKKTLGRYPSRQKADIQNEFGKVTVVVDCEILEKKRKNRGGVVRRKRADLTYLG